jgi:NADH-quinone oxidoreductase subunit G
MAVITIDHKPFEVDQHKNLLETAISLGLDVPYFCWHPSLGSVGSCRLCAVQQMSDENDTVGRTVMACMTPCKDQSRFSIAHPTAKDFRAAVVEWLMTNHPHDCPICDEGGECHLQDMTMLAGHNYRNYRFLKRTHRNQNLGPFINHEMNRCITCYRCVRYYRDIAGGTDLSAFKSSGLVYFGRFAEGSLQSEFSGNLVEICPTGVFTDKPYHQRYVRKWDLSTSPSLCQLCGVGCNISLGERGGILRRVQNRYHHDVNGFFICDRGRFGHDFVNSDRRLWKHSIKQNGMLVEVSPDAAMNEVKQMLSSSKSIIGIGSPTASLEANFLLKRLVGADNFYDALTPALSCTIDEAVATLSERVVNPASLKHVREADAVLVIGEDLTNTAPVTALAIRQAAMAFKQKASKQDLAIDTWNDAAVRDYARGDLLPVFSISALATSLDPLCHDALVTHPRLIAPIVHAIEEALADRPITANLSKATPLDQARQEHGISAQPEK